MSEAMKIYPRGEEVDPWCGRVQRQEGTPYEVCLGNFSSPGGFPCTHPPWNELVMVNVSSGAQIWRKTYGYQPNPKFSPDWGSIRHKGGISETLGGIIFASGTGDRHLWGFDAHTGNQIFLSSEFQGDGQTTPMTYRVKGIQYVVLVTSTNTTTRVLAWSLDESVPLSEERWSSTVVGSLFGVILLVFVYFYMN